MRKRRMNIRNAVIGDPIDFYIETKEKNAKRRAAVSERMSRGLAAARMTLRVEEERSIMS